MARHGTSERDLASHPGRQAEDYLDFNDGHVLDMGETRQGKGGVDRVVEWKAYSPLVQVSTSPPMDTSYRGSTHAFGNTEEHLRRTKHWCEGPAG
jgi:hypothetical protein